MTVDKSDLAARKAAMAEQVEAQQADIEHSKERAEKRKEWKEKAVTWKPDEGEELWGTLLDGAWVATDYGPKRVLTIQDAEDAEKIHTVWVSGTVFDKEFDRYSPRIGAVVGIKFVGKIPLEGTRYYNMWAMQVSNDDVDHEFWADSKRRMEEFIAKKAEQQANASSAYADDGLADPYG